MVERGFGKFLRFFGTGAVAFCISCLFAGCGSSPSEKEGKRAGEPPSVSSAESPPASPISAPHPPPDAGEVLSFHGSGGVVRIGDSLETAKKAMPPQKGAYETGPTSFMVFAEEGWAWFTTENTVGFEVMLRGGKVDGIAHTDSGKDREVYRRLVEETIQRLGEPTRKAKGKFSEVYVWEKGDYARMEVVAEMAPGRAFHLCLIGRGSDLKVLNYRPDDPQTLVMQMDLSANLARKELQRSPNVPKKK